MDEDGYIYVAFITLRSGRRLYAHEVGLKAFRFKPREKKDEQRSKR